MTSFLVLLDHSIAFDIVNHAILCQKLKTCALLMFTPNLSCLKVSTRRKGRQREAETLLKAEYPD